MPERKDRLSANLKRLASLFIRTNMAVPGTVVSITSCTVSKDFKRATLFVSVYPESREVEIEKGLSKKMTGLRDYVRTRVTMKVLPFFDVVIDKGEQYRQRFNELLNEIKE